MQYARPDAIAGAKVEGPARSAGGNVLLDVAIEGVGGLLTRIAFGVRVHWMHPFGGLRLSHGHKISDALGLRPQNSSSGQKRSPYKSHSGSKMFKKVALSLLLTGCLSGCSTLPSVNDLASYIPGIPQDETKTVTDRNTNKGEPVGTAQPQVQKTQAVAASQKTTKPVDGEKSVSPKTDTLRIGKLEMNKTTVRTLPRLCFNSYSLITAYSPNKSRRGHAQQSALRPRDAPEVERQAHRHHLPCQEHS